jgi:S1-C subfamily serine protease
MDTPEIGENITVIGNPEGLKNSLSTGIVAGIREIGGNKWVQITAPVSPGSSGSPVFDSKGRLLGLATMMLLDGQNLNFATPVRQVEADVAKKTEPTFFLLFCVWFDNEYERRKEVLESRA